MSADKMNFDPLIHFVLSSLFFIAVFPSFAQVIIFEELFDEVNGSTSGVDVFGTPWTLDCPSCDAGDIFEVNEIDLDGDGNPLKGIHGNNTNGEAKLVANGINISDGQCAFVTFSITAESIPFAGSENLDCPDECVFGGGCMGDVYDPLAGGCSNCWDFLYAELYYPSAGSSVRVLLMGDDCNEDGVNEDIISPAICVVPDASDGDEDLESVSVQIVTNISTGDEDIVYSNLVVTCYTLQEAHDAGIDTTGCLLLSLSNLDLAAELVGNDVLLQWSGIDLSPYDRLVLQRASSAGSWQSIRSWNVHNAETPLGYIDYGAPSGALYYRLQGWRDNVIVNSPTVHVLVQSTEIQSSFSFPEKVLSIRSPALTSYTVHVYDAQGRRISDLGRHVGTANFTLNDLLAGVYFVQIRDQYGDQKTKRIVISL